MCARLSVQSSELGPPQLLTHKGVLLLPPLGPRGETHSLAGEGLGGPNSDEGTYTLVLYVYFNPSTDFASSRYVRPIKKNIYSFNTASFAALRLHCVAGCWD
jgi:hypothetical protein